MLDCVLSVKRRKTAEAEQHLRRWLLTRPTRHQEAIVRRVDGTMPTPAFVWPLESA